MATLALLPDNYWTPTMSQGRRRVGGSFIEIITILQIGKQEERVCLVYVGFVCEPQTTDRTHTPILSSNLRLTP